MLKTGFKFEPTRLKRGMLTHFSQFISVKVKKILIKPQIQFREKLKKLRLRQNDGFLIKKPCKEIKPLSLPYQFWVGSLSLNRTQTGQSETGTVFYPIQASIDRRTKLDWIEMVSCTCMAYPHLLENGTKHPLPCKLNI